MRPAGRQGQFRTASDYRRAAAAADRNTTGLPRRVHAAKALVKKSCRGG
jgi:hypothetical protein